MSDTLTPAQRSHTMRQVRGRDTGPELFVRSLLHDMGLRFTVNGPKNRELPGKPDIVLPRHNLIVFVHGCFWHRHQGCKRATTPSTRVDYWNEKFRRNVERDQRNQAKMKELGWRVLVIWECELESPRQLRDKITEFLTV